MDDTEKEKMGQRLMRRFRWGAPTEEEEAAFVEMMNATDLIIDLPQSQWPPFEMRWDLEPGNYFLALDGSDAESFAEDYPEGVEVILVDLTNLDSRLIRMSSQVPSEFWEIGNPRAKARIIWELSSGKSVTPTFVKIHDDNLSLYIAGGNNRLAVARAKGLREVPILVSAVEKCRILEILDPDFYRNQ